MPPAPILTDLAGARRSSTPCPLAKTWPSHMSSHPGNVTSHQPSGWGCQACGTQGARLDSTPQRSYTLSNTGLATGFWAEYYVTSVTAQKLAFLANMVSFLFILHAFFIQVV